MFLISLLTRFWKSQTICPILQNQMFSTICYQSAFYGFHYWAFSWQSDFDILLLGLTQAWLIIIPARFCSATSTWNFLSGILLWVKLKYLLIYLWSKTPLFLRKDHAKAVCRQPGHDWNFQNSWYLYGTFKKTHHVFVWLDIRYHSINVYFFNLTFVERFLR
jgi:hypothetical protein